MNTVSEGARKCERSWSVQSNFASDRAVREQAKALRENIFATQNACRVDPGSVDGFEYLA